MRILDKTPLLVIAVAASQCGATDCGEIVRDPGFDLWCGDQLCSWKIARGEVHQVPTWHEGDDGAELGDDTAIYQLTPVDSTDGNCIEFELVADVDPGVNVRFQADVFGDGTIELDDPIPSARWQPLTYRFDIAGSYQGIQFWIVKQGSGHAVVAQLQARTCGSGPGANEHVDPGPRPDGALCAVGSQCASGVCEQFPGAYPPPYACGECEIGSACANPGDVCGLAPPARYTLGASTACVPMASKQLGEQCGVNEECADGSCSFGVCSSCFAQSCGAGIACDVSVHVPLHSLPLYDYPAPFVCAPGAGAAAAGAPCGADADCASGTCDGALRRVCEDGRACANDADCPVVDGLDHGVCETVGVIGGTCQ